MPSTKTSMSEQRWSIIQRKRREKKIRFPEDFVKEKRECQGLGKRTGECADEERRVGFGSIPLHEQKRLVLD
ncbi:hypothetical protein EAI_10884 [Harpegnathos saltator]|uniref:Uncharacterized protein n=1 Tax=Harpegnathos saltator TaxID=610380 RepID=E2B5W9_HARSA|nr:hypothetical protein EAI_10884 [Harpegnathos saltator]